MLINRQAVEPRWIVIENFIDHLGIDFTFGFKPIQSQQLAGIVGVAVIRADHQAVFTGILQYVRQIIIGLAGNEQLTAVA